MDVLVVLGHWTGLLAMESVFSAVVFAVVAAMAWLLRRRGPAVHIALWSLVFVRLVLPPGWTHPLGVGGLVESLTEFRIEGVGLSFDETGAHGVEGGSVLPVLFTANRDEAVGTGPLVGTLWLLGFCTVAGGLLRRICALRTLIAAANPPGDPRVIKMGEAWRRRLGVRRRVRIVVSESGMTPFTVGVLRPVISLPACLVNDLMSTEAAVAHEMGHVARLDALWLRLQQAVQAVYFFNPLVWISGARLTESRERLCDATVLAANCIVARDYAEGLLRVLRLDLRRAGAPNLSARQRRIGVRINGILTFDNDRRPHVGGAVTLCCVLGFFLLPMGAVGAGADAEIGHQVERSSPSLQPPQTMMLANPVPGSRVTWAWGPGQLDPFTHEPVSHSGIDLAANSGTPVVAPEDGVVIVATETYGPSPASGTVIVIDHGHGLSTFYAHLAAVAVEEGQTIDRGAVIGSVGSTGKSTGPHLHFEIRRDGEAVDPADYVEDWNR